MDNEKYCMEELLPIVAELTEKFTSRESTSVTYEKAKQLMGAVLYCIHEYEAVNGEKPALMKTGSAATARDAYQDGGRLVVEKTKMAKELFNQILPKFRDYRNRAYYDTVVKGMPAFFVNYDAKFYPQNHILTLDYPVLVSLENLEGIDRIYAYLQCIKMEQEFLGCLPQAYIENILEKIYGEYEELFINLAEVVLQNILGCMLSGKEISIKSYTNQEIERISVFVQGKSREELEAVLEKLIEEVVRQGYKNRSEMAAYLKAAARGFSVQLHNAAEHDCLHAILAL